MEEEKQFLKYLSWLDDLVEPMNQELIFGDTENVLAIRMDQHDLTGQPSTNSGLQYDENMTNFDYSTKIMSEYGGNEVIMTGGMNASQPNVIPDPYHYNFLPNDNFYSNSALPQQHIPMKADLHTNESPFCVDLSNAVHPNDDSYANTSDPQLCIDMSADSANLSVPQESSQYTLPHSMDIKENFYHEEKHIVDNSYPSEQLSIHSDLHNVNTSFANEFSQITHPNDMFCGQVPQETMHIDHVTTHQIPFTANLQNLDDPQNSATTDPSITIHDDFKDALNMNLRSEDNKPNFIEQSIIQESPIVQSSTENVQEDSRNEIKREEEANQIKNEPETHSAFNGDDKANVENDISSLNVQMCIRNGCANHAVNNPEWEQEFCSNDCVIVHCRNVFMAWVKSNAISSQ